MVTINDSLLGNQALFILQVLKGREEEKPGDVFPTETKEDWN